MEFACPDCGKVWKKNTLALLLPNPNDDRCKGCGALFYVDLGAARFSTSCPECQCPNLVPMPEWGKTVKCSRGHYYIVGKRFRQQAEQAAQRQQREEREKAYVANLWSSGDLIKAPLNEIVVCSNGHRYSARDFYIEDRRIGVDYHVESYHYTNAFGETKIGNRETPYNYEERRRRFGCPACKSTLSHFQNSRYDSYQECKKCGNWYHVQEISHGFDGKSSTRGSIGCPLCEENPYKSK